MVDFGVAEDEDQHVLGLAYNIVQVLAGMMYLAAGSRRHSHTEIDFADHMLAVLVVTLMPLVETHSLVVP